MEETDQLRQIARQCADSADGWRRAFRRAAWVFIYSGTLFAPAGVLFIVVAFTQPPPLWRAMFAGAGGGLLINLAIIAFLNAKRTFEHAEEAFTNFMAIRQNCLDAIKEIEDL